MSSSSAIQFKATLNENLSISSEGQDGPAAGLGFSPTESERKVVNYARERKKLTEQIATTSDAEVKSKLAKRLEQVEKQIRMLNLL